ncbi:hypothetical protein RRSWK_07141 [Rhodopirellula sp. SWK7]|nr:hypothetical protein RRSWK_07141 [Rhodopirellula sp. SWK7]
MMGTRLRYDPLGIKIVIETMMLPSRLPYRLFDNILNSVSSGEFSCVIISYR